MMAGVRRTALLVALGAVIVLFTMAFRVEKAAGPRLVYSTVGEVQAVHARVAVAGAEVRGTLRVSAGERIETSADGRARARLDDGTSIIVDRATRLTAADAAVSLEVGRLFVRGTGGAHTQLSSGKTVVHVGASTVAAERNELSGDAQFFCVSGEVVATVSGKDLRVRSGETLHVHGDAVSVAPEAAWNDWTRGMAHPWGAGGSARAAIGELWGRPLGDTVGGGAPLAVRSHDVRASIVGEVATTEIRTTYFNAGGTTVTGDFRMAVPPAAIVSGFATGAGDSLTSGSVRVESDTDGSDGIPVLEWAGEGWLRGRTGAISAGQTATVLVRYVEWLSPAGGHLTYRYPMLSEGAPPLIGEFHAVVDVAGVDPARIGLGAGMTIQGDTLELRRADFRPTSDLVVDFTLRAGAFEAVRGYLLPADDDAAGSFLLVRSEVAPRASQHGVTLAVVVDTSRSIDPPLLEAERAVVEALLEGLGAEDRVVVFASDEGVRPLGPPAVAAVDETLRAALRRALGDLRSGGATDLGVALERAADALPKGSDATLLYVGDGWPTLGDMTVDAIRTRLSRRAGGIPRLGAVAVGPTANRFGLAALVRGAGPVFAIDDREAAAQVAVNLLAEALRPSVANAQIDLGVDVERVYPRGGQTVRAGDTLTVAGRIRGRPSRVAQIRFRDGDELKVETLRVSTLPVVDGDDLRRRWSAARVEELMLRGGGREAVVDTALRNGLLTPWTGWAVGVSPGGSFRATPLAARVLDAGLDGSLAVFSARFATRAPAVGALAPPRDDAWPSAKATEHDALRAAAEWSARRTLDDARASVRQCRDSRAALRPELGGSLQLHVSIGDDGRVREASVRGGSAIDDDAALDRCVELVVRSLSFFVPGVPLGASLTYELRLPPAREVKATHCSPTSMLPSPMRRGVWFERLRRPASDDNPLGTRGELAYLRAKAACELPSWADRRTFLELLIEQASDGVARVDLARLMEDAGDADAASLVRREAVRRAETPDDLLAVKRALLATEPDISTPFVRAYAKASTDASRLTVVQSFLRLAPHDARLRRKELALLETLGQKEALVAVSFAVRDDPFLDAGLLADTASALRRVGEEEEARRTFGELAERAPLIPFARAFLGDRLLDEGRYDEAASAFEALVRLLPDDPAGSLRLALAQAGAGRLDIALRLLSHVTETGGRTSDATLGELASTLSLVLIDEARDTRPRKEEDERLRRRGLEVSSPADLSALVLVRVPTWVPGLQVSVRRGSSGDDAVPVVLVPSLGLAGIRLERGEGPFRITVGRREELVPARAAAARLSVLLFTHGEDLPRLVTKEIPLRADGEALELRWTGTDFL